MGSLMQEYLALCRQLAKVQARCSAVMAEQAARTDRLERDLLRLRARLVRLTTEQAWAREDAAAPPGVPRRKAGARHIADVVKQVRRLVRRGARWRMGLRAPDAAAEAAAHDEGPRPLAALAACPAETAAEQVLAQATAEWVICQAGCLSHDAYWRVQDHCRRTGQACLLVDAPQAAHWASAQHAPQTVVPVRVERIQKAGI